MKSKPTIHGRQERMPWKKSLTPDSGAFGRLRGGLRAWAKLIYDFAYADGWLDCPPTVSGLAMLLRVHATERGAFAKTIAELQSLGILSHCKDTDSWRVNVPDIAANEEAILRERCNPREEENVSPCTPPDAPLTSPCSPPALPIEVNPMKSLGRPHTDLDLELDRDLEKRINTSNVSYIHKHSPNQLERARDPEPLPLVLTDYGPPGADPALPVCVSSLEQLVLDAWNETTNDRRRHVRWNAQRLKWFRRCMREEGHTAQEAVAIVLGWCYVPWVDANQVHSFTTVWSPKLQHVREAAIPLGTYNPSGEFMLQMRRLDGKPRPLVVCDPLGPEPYRFGATEEDLGHVPKFNVGSWETPAFSAGLMLNGDADSPVE